MDVRPPDRFLYASRRYASTPVPSHSNPCECGPYLLSCPRSGLWRDHAQLLIRKERETELTLGGWAGSKEVRYLNEHMCMYTAA